MKNNPPPLFIIVVPLVHHRCPFIHGQLFLLIHLCGSFHRRWSLLFIHCPICALWRSPPHHLLWVGDDLVTWWCSSWRPPSFIPIPTGRSAPGIHPGSSGSQACWQRLVLWVVPPSFVMGGSFSFAVGGAPLIRCGWSPFICHV
jgi:hypothetical protein